MIASRNADRLKAAATDLQKQLPEGSTAELEYTVCNIRQEEQVYVVWIRVKQCNLRLVIAFNATLLQCTIVNAYSMCPLGTYGAV